MKDLFVRTIEHRFYIWWKYFASCIFIPSSTLVKSLRNGIRWICRKGYGGFNIGEKYF
jgi:hypothetical protein